MVTAFFFLSLGVNAIVTALIVYKIITVSNILRFHISTVQGSAANGSGQLHLSPLISILIESGLITFVGQLAQSIMYKYDSSAFPMVGGCVVILYVRLHVDFLVDFVVIFSSTYYYTGNFDVSCPCVCGEGQSLQHIKDGESSKFGAPHTATSNNIYVEDESEFCHRHCRRWSTGTWRPFREEAHVQLIHF